MPDTCKCGHGGDRHDEEQPYPCYECGCDGFEAKQERPAGGSR